MAKYRDEVELLLSARNEQIAVLRQAEAQARALAQRQDAESRKQLQRARDIANVEAEILDTSLRHAGRALDADILRVQNYYNRKIRTALDANDIEYADRLATLKEIKEAEARAKHQEASQDKSLRDLATGALGRASAVAAIGRSLEGATKGLIESRNAGDDLHDSIVRLTEGAANAIPVINNYFRAGRNLRELFTSEQQSLESLQRLNELAARNLKEREDSFDRTQQLRETRLRAERDLLNELAVLRTAPEERDALSLRLSNAEQVRQAEQRILDLRKQAADLSKQQDTTADREALDNVTRELERQRGLLRISGTASEERIENSPTIRLLVEQQRKLQDALNIRRDSIAAIQSEANELERVVDLTRQAAREREIDLQRQRQAAEATRQREEAQQRELRWIETRNQYMRELRQQRLQELDDERDRRRETVEQLREQQRQANAAASRGPASLPNADQNRFLTGVRERGQAIADATRSREERNAKILQSQLDIATKALKEIEGLRSDLAKRPLNLLDPSGGTRR